MPLRVCYTILSWSRLYAIGLIRFVFSSVGSSLSKKTLFGYMKPHNDEEIYAMRRLKAIGPALLVTSSLFSDSSVNRLLLNWSIIGSESSCV